MLEKTHLIVRSLAVQMAVNQHDSLDDEDEDELPSLVFHSSFIFFSQFQNVVLDVRDLIHIRLW